MPHLVFEFMKIFSCWFTVLCFYTWDPATPCPATQVCTGLRGHWWSVGGLARLLTILLRKDIASSTKHLRQCECVQCLLKEKPTKASAAKVRPIEQYLLIWKTLMIRHGTHTLSPSSSSASGFDSVHRAYSVLNDYSNSVCIPYVIPNCGRGNQGNSYSAQLEHAFALCNFGLTLPVLRAHVFWV